MLPELVIFRVLRNCLYDDSLFCEHEQVLLICILFDFMWGNPFLKEVAFLNKVIWEDRVEIWWGRLQLFGQIYLEVDQVKEITALSLKRWDFFPKIWRAVCKKELAIEPDNRQTIHKKCNCMLLANDAGVTEVFSFFTWEMLKFADHLLSRNCQSNFNLFPWKLLDF